MTGPSPDARGMLSAETWEFLLNKTVLYASGHVNRWYWRGSLGGLLPDGFDANSLAAEAIAEFLNESAQSTHLATLSLDEILRKLERCVRRHVNRLHHRTENRLLRNEPDLLPVTLDDGEAVSVIELIPEPSRPPDDALLEKEALIRFDQSRSRFSTSLGGDRPLSRLFDLFCDGHSKPRELASHLGLRVNAVKNLRRRLLRKFSAHISLRINDLRRT